MGSKGRAAAEPLIPVFDMGQVGSLDVEGEVAIELRSRGNICDLELFTGKIRTVAENVIKERKQLLTSC